MTFVDLQKLITFTNTHKYFLSLKQFDKKTERIKLKISNIYILSDILSICLIFSVDCLTFLVNVNFKRPSFINFQL